MKIQTIVHQSNCPCGRGTVSNYNRNQDFKNINSYICRCEDCNAKYTFKFNPMNKYMFAIDRVSSKVCAMPYTSCKTTEVTKAVYGNEYEYTLNELDELSKAAGVELY